MLVGVKFFFVWVVDVDVGVGVCNVWQCVGVYLVNELFMVFVVQQVDKCGDLFYGVVYFGVVFVIGFDDGLIIVVELFWCKWCVFDVEMIFVDYQIDDVVDGVLDWFDL